MLDNAIKYSPLETELFIKALRKQDELHVSVHDQSAGIPQNEINAIFDQFYRGKTSQTIKGTGLGLTVCKEIINAHGGRIWAESELGQGTTIAFTFPPFYIIFLFANNAG